ncbi:hypothetical protein OB905_13240 [Halobacteria archaeon AArc-dxtr1]|nr:hypothetical protein [Halobacteria archaeon AArc-dxtr1]
MSVRTSNANGDRPRLKTELDDGRGVEIEITGTATNKRRIDVRVDGGLKWVFAVQEDTAGLVMALNQEHGGRVVDAEIPTWMEPLLQRLGLEGIAE